MMRRKLIMLLVAAVLATCWVQVQAQTNGRLSERGWSIAPRLGINFSTLDRWGPEDMLSDWRTGFHAELLVQRRFNNVWAMEFGLGYSREGFRKPFSNGTYADLKRDVVTLPVTAKAYVWKGLYFDAGLYLGYECIWSDSCGGVTFGTGYEMPEGVFFAFNYNLGATNFGAGALASQVCQLTVGWRFGLSRR